MNDGTLVRFHMTSIVYEYFNLLKMRHIVARHFAACHFVARLFVTFPKQILSIRILPALMNGAFILLYLRISISSIFIWYCFFLEKSFVYFINRGRIKMSDTTHTDHTHEEHKEHEHHEHHEDHKEHEHHEEHKEHGHDHKHHDDNHNH